MSDEGQHLTRVTKSIQLSDQAYMIYSLAEATGTTHILFGTYELLPLMHCLSVSGHRNVLLHFPPYHLNRTSDRQEFQRLLFTFQHHLPLADVPDLTGNIIDLYRRSLGCGGVLKQWLSSALKDALEAGQRTLTLADLDRHALEKSKLLQMAYEAQAGEQAFLSGDWQNPIPSRSELAQNDPKKPMGSKKQGQSRRIGERKARRDKVGR